MTKVCWVQHASEYPLNIAVARVLNEKGISSIFVCKTITAHERYKEEGFESYLVVDIFNDAMVLSNDILKKLDFTYGPPSIRAIGDSDAQMIAYYGDRYSEKLQLIGRAYKFWEHFLSEHTINAFISPETATFLTRTIYNIARHNRIPFGQLVIGPSQKSFVIDDVDESHIWSGFLEKLEKGVRELSKEERIIAKDFIDSKIQESKEGLSLRFVPSSFYRSLREYIGMWFYDRPSLRRSDPVRVAALRYGRRLHLKKIIWKYITQPFFSYDTPKDSDSFIYFPIYSGNETNYLVNDHYWSRNEISLIKEVAQSLPIGHMLYVKEHPLNPGDLTYQDLQELKQVSNIRVLHPSVSSHDLIENSDGVFVLQGTTGWEAFLARKPVVVMGKTFFAHSSLVYSVKDPTEFLSVFWKMIQKGGDVYKENEKEWMWFIYCVASTCGKGMTVRHRPPYGFVEDRENAEAIADYILNHLIKK